MSNWMNESEITDAAHRVDPAETPVLATGILLLTRLVVWTNQNSDGWCYWQKPSNAASKLQGLIESKNPHRMKWDDEPDITEAELRKAITPIKAMLTKHGVDANAILYPPPPEPYCNHDAPAIHQDGEGRYFCECGQEVKPVFVAAS